MRTLTLSIAAAGLTVLALSQPARAEADLTTDLQKFSYAVGVQIGRNLANQGMNELDGGALSEAIQDMLKGKEPRISTEEMNQAAQTFQKIAQEKKMAEAEQAKAGGVAFLAENKTKEGVVETDSGLQYKIIEAGEGDKRPTGADMIKVHYKGELLNGTVFDSSIQRGEPAEFQVGRVIPGWQEALQLMNVGASWEVWIPSDLAYGERGAGAAIGPHETLHFTIQLLEIK